MKIARSELKKLVKECLIELLSEGLSSPEESLSEQIDRSIPSRRSEERRPPQGPRRPKFDPNLDRPVLEAARHAAGADQVMAGILADTAKTTYAKIGGTLMNAASAIESEGMPVAMPIHGLDAVSQTVADADPSELFGEDVTNNWAALAFRGQGGRTSNS